MHFGLTIFPTQDAIAFPELAVEAEQRGFESLWVAEHSHIPASRLSPWPGGAELPQFYYDAMDPFAWLSAAAAVTTENLICGRVIMKNALSLVAPRLRATRSWLRS